jgi:hypothetical protein
MFASTFGLTSPSAWCLPIEILYFKRGKAFVSHCIGLCNQYEHSLDLCKKWGPHFIGFVNYQFDIIENYYGRTLMWFGHILTKIVKVIPRRSRNSPEPWKNPKHQLNCGHTKFLKITKKIKVMVGSLSYWPFVVIPVSGVSCGLLAFGLPQFKKFLVNQWLTLLFWDQGSMVSTMLEVN